MGRVAQTDRQDAPWRINDVHRGVTDLIEDFAAGLEDPLRQQVVPDALPEVLDAVAFGCLPPSRRALPCRTGRLAVDPPRRTLGAAPSGSSHPCKVGTTLPRSIAKPIHNHDTATEVTSLADICDLSRGYLHRNGAAARQDRFARWHNRGIRAHPAEETGTGPAAEHPRNRGG